MNPEMKSYKRFAHYAKRVESAPPVSAWSRLEAKLENRRARRRLTTARYISSAAVILILISVFAGTIFYMDVQSTQRQANSYSGTIEDLAMTTTDGIYDPAFLKDLHNQFSNN